MEWQGKQDTLPRAECTMQEGLRIRHSRNLSRCSINADVQPVELSELDADLESQGKHAEAKVSYPREYRHACASVVRVGQVTL